MRKIVTALSVIAMTTGILLALPDGGAAKPKHDIKAVMKAAHKDGLLKKVSEGKGDKADKAKLLELYTALWDNTPPAGDKASWAEKSGALLAAAAKAVLDQDGAADALKAAANCKACHDVHKKKM